MSRLDVIREALADMDPDTLLWVHRDFPGKHVDDESCWCCPLAFNPNLSARAIEARLRLAELRN